MARDKSKDDNLFNCSQDYEHDHVVRQYPKEYQDKIRDFLKKACQNKKYIIVSIRKFMILSKKN
ncbi:hypothetical protein ACNF92_08490 [Campylobacter jejuni]